MKANDCQNSLCRTSGGHIQVSTIFTSRVALEVKPDMIRENEGLGVPLHEMLVELGKNAIIFVVIVVPLGLAMVAIVRGIKRGSSVEGRIATSEVECPVASVAA